jgi:hypothetical protein
VTSYAVDVTCPLCEGPASFVTAGRPGDQTGTVVECEPCGETYLLRLTLDRVTHSLARKYRAGRATP